MDPVSIALSAAGVLAAALQVGMMADVSFSGLRGKMEDLQEQLKMIESGLQQGADSTGLQWWLEDAVKDALELMKEQRNEGFFTLVLGGVDRLRQTVDGLRQNLQQLQRCPQTGKVPRDSDTGHMTLCKKFFGYKKEKGDLVSSLVAGDAQVVAIIGRGGTGKTELARWVLSHDPDVQAHFPETRRYWVCVYGKFKASDILDAIWKSVTGRGAAVDGIGVPQLQKNLEEWWASEGKKLIVLDDICNDESAAAAEVSRTWAQVLAPFRLRQDRGNGSRILVTTRAEICYRTLLHADDRIFPIFLDGIQDADAIKLLKYTAFGNENVANIPGVQNVGSLLHGSPLSAEIVGECLKKGDTDSTSWKQRLEKDFARRHISSFCELPRHLRRCFAFCSILPMARELQPEKLMKMWVTHGFVEVSDGRMAQEYFDALVDRSLIKKKVQHPNGIDEKIQYVIHEEIHSMLRQVAPGYYLNIHDGIYGKGGIPATVRHLSVSSDCVYLLKGYGSSWLERLRTLLVYHKAGHGGAASSSSSSASQSSTDAIGKKVLRKLERVRVLDCSPAFVTERLEGIKELERLNALHGELRIEGLEEVHTMEDAQRAHLGKKEHLEALKLVWKKHKDPIPTRLEGEHFSVLCGLQPHSNLQKLTIQCYAGRNSPIWVASRGELKNLTSMYLISCMQLNPLPPVAGLPCLKFLHVMDLRSLAKIDSAYFCGGPIGVSSLETMVIEKMSKLADWNSGPEDRHGNARMRFPHLKIVKIIDCPELTSISGLLCCRTSLAYLRLKRCPKVTAPSARNFPSLKQNGLHISH
ncbi:hypothetical protein ACP4OV_010364 [Aristida adscensionis]